MAQLMQFELFSALGNESLRLHALTGRESLGYISEFRLECLSDKPDIDLDVVLGKQASVRISLPDGQERFLTGYFTRFAHTGTHGRFQSYEATLQPWPWFLTRTADCRIFQNKSVPEIIKEVFADHDVAEFRDALAGSYATREYCVQYRETDFDFVARLMEEEGIYFFFEYEKNKNVLVLADAYSAHNPVPGNATFEFVDNRSSEESDHITSWHFERIVQPGKTRSIDYDFKRPSLKLDVKASHPRGNSQSNHEIFDYPGDFVEMAEGEHFVRTRMDELQSQYELAHGRTSARSIGCGMLFKLKGHVRSDQNREYLITACHTHLQAEGLEAQGGGGSLFASEITALESKQDFRPARVTPRPFVRGIQTAVVVGPSGDEIYTDKYSRIKVQFHWDRLGKNDENSSCWMRVAQPWAGKQWGFITIPRIGQEVVVEFLEGDPDRPLITGSVYNGEQMPPYELPANMTQSGIKTRSSKQGTPENFNEIRFEDKKGSEQLFIHAEKNQDIEVENDETHWVGNDRTKKVDNNETIIIGVDQSETVGRNRVVQIGTNHSENIGAAMSIVVGTNLTETVAINYSETVGAAMELTVGAALAITVGAVMSETVGGAKTEAIGGSKSESIGGDQTMTVGKNVTQSIAQNQTVTVGKDFKETIAGKHTVEVAKEAMLQAKKVQIIADDEIMFKTGSAEIIMKKNGDITIKGNKITVKGSGDVILKGSKVLSN